MLILGIETSCDDTCVSVVRDGVQILSNVISSQERFHNEYQGVVPDIASRKHSEYVFPTLQKALLLANVSLLQIDAIAVTTRPGLLVSLLIGVNAAKGLACGLNKPLIPVHHLVAHLYSLPMSTKITYPHLSYVLSGGHTLLVYVTGPLDFQILGSTLDDACGEAFDKVAKFLGLGYPGGPEIDKLAISGDPNAIAYPHSMMHNKQSSSYNLSYSGLKTSVLYETQKRKKKEVITINDICASFSKAVVEPLLSKAKRACKQYDLTQIGICGGVAQNTYLRIEFSSQKEWSAFFPPPKLCVDNAAMVAGIAYHLFLRKQYFTDIRDILDVDPNPKPVRSTILEF